MVGFQLVQYDNASDTVPFLLSLLGWELFATTVQLETIEYHASTTDEATEQRGDYRMVQHVGTVELLQILWSDPLDGLGFLLRRRGRFHILYDLLNSLLVGSLPTQPRLDLSAVTDSGTSLWLESLFYTFLALWMQN